MEPQARVVYEQIKEELANERLAEATALLVQEHPADAADILMELEEPQRLLVLAEAEAPQVAALFDHLDSLDAAALMASIEPGAAAAVLDESAPDVAADVLGKMLPEQAALVLERMQEAKHVAPLLLQPEESAAGLMTPEYLALEATWTVEETLWYLRRVKPEENIDYLYVLDAERHLIGVVRLRALVVAMPRTTLQQIMNPEVVSVKAGVDREEAARIMRHYDLLALPVVDEEDRLLGIITFDDAADVLEEEATEDIYHMAGMSSEERVQGPFLATLRRRMPWLLVNLLTAFLSANVVSMFEPTIERMTALAIFMPVIAGHGGNTGTQAITLMIRGLALGEIRLRDTSTILVREFGFGIVHGCVAGLIAALIALILVGNPWLGVVVGVAMLGNVLLAVTLGALLPMLLRALNLDPALMSSIFLTTFTDIGGFLMLLGLGTLLLSKLLGL